MIMAATDPQAMAAATAAGSIHPVCSAAPAGMLTINDLETLPPEPSSTVRVTR